MASAALRYVLSADTRVAAVPTLAAFVARYRARDAFPRELLGGQRELCGHVDDAMLGGYASDRLGWAFAEGYQSALRRVFPQLPPGELAALCATERGGVGAGAMATRMRAAPGGGGAVLLDGEKAFVSLGDEAQHLAIVCVDADADGGAVPAPVAVVPAAAAGAEAPPAGRRRQPLRLVLLDRRLAGGGVGGTGITMVPRPPLLFCPEVSHCQLLLRSVHVPRTCLLSGDAYVDVVKPFRTIEDTCVHAAALGFLVRVARGAAWPRPVVEELAAGIAALRGVGAMSPVDAATHVALAGQIASTERTLAAIAAAGLWSAPTVDAADAERWARDAPLLRVATKARLARTESAWRALAATS
jgi:acyl-CoA dehydrogenase